MRRRNIKSVAHWVVMCFILLFPIVMVGISSFAQKQQEINVTETYEYETNEVSNISDLVVGNIYKMNIPVNELDSTTTQYTRLQTVYKFTLVSENNNRYKNIDFTIDSTNDSDFLLFVITNTQLVQVITYINNTEQGALINYSINNITNIEMYFVLHDQIMPNNWFSYISSSDYLGEKTIDYTITDQTMRDDVNEWCASFRNLPVNVWYGNLLSAIGLGITTSMMMNVIYTYPLYVLWVYILDLVVDIFLVIINFGHNALKRLGGDNE